MKFIWGCNCDLQEDVWRTLDEEAAFRSPPLLALLPLCAGAADVPLAHNVAALARRLVDKVTSSPRHCTVAFRSPPLLA